MSEFVEVAPPVAGDGEFSEDVERAGVGGPGGAAERLQCGGVDGDRELAGFFVGEPVDSQTGAEFAQRGCEAVIVGFGGGGDEVDVVGLVSCSVELGGEAADHDVVDPVAVEYCEHSFGIEPLRFSRHGRVRGPR